MLNCHVCNYPLEYPGQECPKCGSRLIFMTETMGISERNIPETAEERQQRIETGGPKIGFEVRKKDKSLYKGPWYEKISEAQEIYRETGEETTVYRRLNKPEDLYEEHITGSDGRHIKDDVGSLREHQGHGSAKWRKKDDDYMDKLKMETPDLTQANIEKLAALFPACVTEARGKDGRLKKAVNFELLRQLLSDVVLEGDEAYEFTWVGKKAAIVEANRPIRKTLRPCPAESVDWDTTENLYIEGDNLEVLKLLQESYLGKVKMIYIDPPYNTGNDFIYQDAFAMSRDDFSEGIGQIDEETGDRLFRNTDSNGRFHSDWCSMMYSRLMLARNLLSDDGVIFISIDDSEQGCLKKICDEIFGASNFINTIIWEKRYSPQNAVQWFSENHDFMLVYAKNKLLWHPQLLERTDEMNARYTNRDNDPRGPWKAENSTAQGGHGTKSQFYVLTAPNGKKHYLPSGRC